MSFFLKKYKTLRIEGFRQISLDSCLTLTKIFCKMNVATVFESSDPDSMILRQRGIISVVRRKLITSWKEKKYNVTNCPILPFKEKEDLD